MADELSRSTACRVINKYLLVFAYICQVHLHVWETDFPRHCLNLAQRPKPSVSPLISYQNGAFLWPSKITKQISRGKGAGGIENSESKRERNRDDYRKQ